MASYLQIENISKSYGPKVLFEHIGFNINEGDKVALIAPNGTGKTSLLRILAGKDSSDRLISVIIPVYNTGRQLYGKAVPSLLRSSMFKNMEIIVVDDGSTDRETLLIEDYLSRHLSNMVLYRFNDRGSGSASRPRNKGQDLATGRYTVFLDSDDEIIDDSLSKLYQDISNNGNGRRRNNFNSHFVDLDTFLDD